MRKALAVLALALAFLAGPAWGEAKNFDTDIGVMVELDNGEKYIITRDGFVPVVLHQEGAVWFYVIAGNSYPLREVVNAPRGFFAETAKKSDVSKQQSAEIKKLERDLRLCNEANSMGKH